MKFAVSMEMVDLNRQQPNRNRRESKYYWDELFTLVSAAGFRGIELPYDLKWSFGGRSGVPLNRYAIQVKFGTVAAFLGHLSARGIDALCGLHFDPSLFFSPELDAYFGAFGHFAAEALGFAAEAGCDSLTLTPTPPAGLIPAGSREALLDRTASLIERLAHEARETGVRLCVKNEYWGLLAGERLFGFMERLPDNAYFGIDTANLQIAGQDPAVFIARCAGRIGSVQFTDTSFTGGRDVLLQPLPEFPAGNAATQVFRDIGQGGADLAGAYHALNRAGYDGWIVMNNRQTRDVARALLRTRYHIDTTIVKEVR